MGASFAKRKCRSFSREIPAARNGQKIQASSRGKEATIAQRRGTKRSRDDRPCLSRRSRSAPRSHLSRLPSQRTLVRQHSMKFLTLLLTALLVSLVAARTEESRSDITAFADLEKQHAGSRIGVAAIDLSTNRRVDYRSDERFIMCSTFKVLAAAAVLKRVDENKEKLDRFVRYGEAQLMTYAPVTREHVKEGGMTLEALCAAAVEQSDNTAANLVLEAIGGPEKWTEFARSLGDNFSRLNHNEPDLNITRPGKEDTTTPAAMCADLQRLFTSDILS